MVIDIHFPKFSLFRKACMLFVLVTALTCSSKTILAQERVAQRVPASERAIPRLVLSEFKTQYPDVLVKSWYVTHITYWYNDYSSGWYSDWYGNRTVVVYSYSQPSYFEVEFVSKPGELSRAIYNINGYWYETRSQIRALPLVVSDALKQSEYADWKVSQLKERIESPDWPVDIYRFRVSKGVKSRIVRIDEKGNIIQAKHLND